MSDTLPESLRASIEYDAALRPAEFREPVALKGTMDPEKFEALQGTVSLSFQPGQHKRIAVKLIDLRGDEMIRVMNLDKERCGA